MKKFGLFTFLTLSFPVWAAQGTLTGTDTSVPVLCTTGIAGVKLEGTYGGGSVALQYERSSNDFRPVLSGGTAKVSQQDDTYVVDMAGPTTYRLLSSAVTSVDYSVDCANTR